MEYDPICLDLLNKIVEKIHIDLWELTRNINWSDKPVDMVKSYESYFYTKKYNIMKSKIEKMVKYGLINKISHDDKSIEYNLNPSIVFKKKIKLNNKEKEFIFIKEFDGKLTASEI